MACCLLTGVHSHGSCHTWRRFHTPHAKSNKSNSRVRVWSSATWHTNRKRLKTGVQRNTDFFLNIFYFIDVSDMLSIWSEVNLVEPRPTEPWRSQLGSLSAEWSVICEHHGLGLSLPSSFPTSTTLSACVPLRWCLTHGPSRPAF